MTVRDQILEPPLALSPDDQVFVIQTLQEHLAELLAQETPESERLNGAEFLHELQQRSAAFQNDSSRARDASEVIGELRLRQSREGN